MRPKAPDKEDETTSLTDDELVAKADHEIAHERLLVAARYLSRVQDTTKLTNLHHLTLKHAQLLQEVIDVHLQPPTLEGSGWNKQTESHGNRDTVVYYKVEDRSKLICRIETPIEESLLVPLLAVLNESQLYEKWMPKWTIPFKMGVRQSVKLKDQPGRGAQIVQVTVDMPFPISDREVVIDTWATDCVDEWSLIAMKGVSLEPGAHDGLVTEPEPGIKRIDFDVDWTIRQCPVDHPSFLHSKHNYPQNEHLLLLTLTQYTNAHVDWVPTSLINFSTRTVLMGQWASLLQVATDVKDGKRRDHEKCIQEKQELYGWGNERIAAMFEKFDQDNKTQSN